MGQGGEKSSLHSRNLNAGCFLNSTNFAAIRIRRPKAARNLTKQPATRSLSRERAQTRTETVNL